MTNKKAKTNSADPDQTASIEAVWSGYSLFAILTSILQIPANQNFIWDKQKKKSVWNIRTFTVTL